jgi:hypothetical protein|mmetsp:Transcript_2858/g.5351  ORF Transcript_2858/g.5351 Transcript_2858/m.5351 type:complete len:158 (-) Transcript_2858:899-1372(-)
MWIVECNWPGGRTPFDEVEHKSGQPKAISAPPHRQSLSMIHTALLYCTPAELEAALSVRWHVSACTWSGKALLHCRMTSIPSKVGWENSFCGSVGTSMTQTTFASLPMLARPTVQCVRGAVRSDTKQMTPPYAVVCNGVEENNEAAPRGPVPLPSCR